MRHAVCARDLSNDTYNKLQFVSIYCRDIPDGFSAQKEGKAVILQKGNEVFYNPAQVVNRDLSIAVINYFNSVRKNEVVRKKRGKTGQQDGKEGLRILEGLAASGLRSIRYAKEIDGVKNIVANDLDPSVVESMKRNIEFNGEDVVRKITPSVGDARIVMMQHPQQFDVVDLDPYGSPCQLLESAIECADEGALLLITATDMAVLCGNNGEACYAKYGSYPLHKSYCHEQAIRILLYSISIAAAKQKRYIVPVLSCSIDFYVRVFVRVYTSPSEVKNIALKHGYIFQSQGCDSFEFTKAGRKILKGNSVKYTAAPGPPVPQKCPETGAGYVMGGPFWGEALHDQEWIRGVLALLRERKSQFASFDKLQGLLTNCLEELPDIPFYVNIHDACSVLKASVPKSEVFKSALINAGYRVSPSHCSPLAIKTDAPWSVIWDILRCWVQEHPVKVKEGTSAAKILAKEPELKADFSRATGSMIPDKKGKNKVPRFVLNPDNWGPRTKHGRAIKKQTETTDKEAELDKK